MERILTGLLIPAAAIVVSVTVPEVRRYFGLDRPRAPSADQSPAAAFQDSAVAPGPADTTGWVTTYREEETTPPPAPVSASFAPGGPTDTVNVSVTEPAWDTVVTITTTRTDTVYGTPR